MANSKQDIRLRWENNDIRVTIIRRATIIYVTRQSVSISDCYLANI